MNIDELRREIKYQPVRLAGTGIRKKSIRGEDIETLIDRFLNNSKGEHKAHLRTILRQHLSDPTMNECCWIEKETGQDPMLAYLIDRESPEELRVPILRAKKNDLLSSMCAQHLILNLINTSASENRVFTVISDIYLEEEIEVFLREVHFYRTQRGWVKVNQKGCHTACDMAEILTSLPDGEDSNLRYYLDKWPGEKIFGIYRFLPIFFFLGATLEFSMINWTVGQTNFCKQMFCTTHSLKA